MESVAKLGVMLIVLYLLSWINGAHLAWVEAHGGRDDYVSLFVVGGVLYTLVEAAWGIGVDSVLILAATVVASGAPIVINSVLSHITQRRCEEFVLHEQVCRMTEFD